MNTLVFSTTQCTMIEITLLFICNYEVYWLNILSYYNHTHGPIHFNDFATYDYNMSNYFFACSLFNLLVITNTNMIVKVKETTNTNMIVKVKETYSVIKDTNISLFGVNHILLELDK